MTSVIVTEAREGGVFVAYLKGHPLMRALGSTRVEAENALWGLYPNYIEAAIIEASERARGIYGVFVNLTVCPRCNRMLTQFGPFDFGGKSQTIAVCPHCTSTKTIAEIVEDVKTMTPGETRPYQLAAGVDVFTFMTTFPLDMGRLGYPLQVNYDETNGLRVTRKPKYRADR